MKSNLKHLGLAILKTLEALEMRIWSVGVACLWLLLVPNVSLAWGSEGHKVVALIAQSQLTSKARSEVDRLLSLEQGESLVSISTWADEHRNPSSRTWHYVNFPRTSCQFEPERDCPDGKCVVGAIKRQLAVLGSKSDDAARLGALKYIVHFVADVHQPLHAGYFDDKGGNTYQLQAFMRGSNLHSLWDTGIIKSLNESPEVLAKRLAKLKSTFPVTELSPVVAAEESCKIVGSEGYYPERRVGQDYIDRFMPVMEQRLKAAGERLAGILNRTLGSK